MDRVIVTTTIHPPTEALEEFAAKSGWHLIVVLDRNSAPFSLPGAEVLTVEDQERLDKGLSDALGWSCIQRRNMGFLHAYRGGADVIASVDDDNIPLPDWGTNVRVGLPTECEVFEAVDPATRAFEPLAVTSANHLWHRGFPLTELPRRAYRSVGTKQITPQIEASLWLGDPDVDAVCRLEHSPYLDELTGPMPFASPLIAPFNSQNTFIAREWLPEYMCFIDVGRYDDIWASYHVQALGASVIFSAASVVQKRNPHDILNDFREEVMGDIATPAALDAISDGSKRAIQAALPPRSQEAFAVYRASMGLDT